MKTALLIARKDLLLNIRSIRFFVGFLLCLLFVPFVMVTGVDDYRMQCKVHRELSLHADSLLNHSYVWSQVRPKVVKRPELLGVFSKGISSNVGVDHQIQLGEYPFFPSPNGDAAARNNVLLNAFLRLDFMDALGIVLSLLALVFSYDTFSREREEGTMRMVFAQPVARSSFLFGKLLGVLFTLVPVLLFCFVLAVGYLWVQPDIHFLLTDWTGILLLLFTSLLFLLFLILFGMFISLLAHRSSTAIMVSLLCWLSFQFVLPPLMTYLSKTFVRVPLYESVIAEMRVLNRELGDKTARLWNDVDKQFTVISQFFVVYNAGEDGFEEVYGGSYRTARMRMSFNARKELLRIWYADRKWQLQQAFLEKMMQQQQLQQWLSRLSPVRVYNQAAAAVCGTSPVAYLEYMSEVWRYRHEVINFFKDRQLFGSISYISTQPLDEFMTDDEFAAELNTWTGDEVKSDSLARIWLKRFDERPYLSNSSDLPRFHQKQVSVQDQLEAGWMMWMILVVLSAGLFGAIVHRFRRYDVR